MNREILDKSVKKSVNGGLAGFSAMTGQVFSMMWLRTVMNYQYRNGGSFTQVTKKLYNEGGVFRFYRGLPFALMQAPISRFGDTMMNEVSMNLLKDTDLSTGTKTFCGSLGAGFWRMLILPIDTCKSTLQVNGKDGLEIIKNKAKQGGVKVFYHGALASGVATAVGHFPWFYTYNTLNNFFPRKKEHTPMESVSRSAAIGFCSSFASDCFSNTFRVIKVNRQTGSSSESYYSLTKNIIKSDGVVGLMTRGLKTKILTNGIQGMIFTILFDYLKRD